MMTRIHEAASALLPTRRTPLAAVEPAQRPPIRIRRPAFNVSEDAPKYFYRGEKGVTALLYALSAVFPEGERMFIDAVHHYRDRVTDDALQKDMRAFAGQEAQHGRLHEAYNAYAMARGFDVDPISQSVKERNALLKKRLPPVARLATTAALEHFTALLAEVLLGDEHFLDGVDPAHAELWRWHAAEEAEHKAVAFDVLDEVSGSYLVRMRSYLVVSVMFPSFTLLHTLHLMRPDGTLGDARAYLGLLRFLFVTPGVLPKIAPGWRAYFRPDFHPWSRDDRELLARWQQASGG